ncbi:MAG TPA: TetR/AcrR family transcriptional regulator [Candidatus Binatia bacterium]|nr:TetR/AcrR family transcriptional regulator [Candidatus Binatia bacterium]
MSVVQTRKDRERAAREELILDHAQRLLLRDGFQNLNLDHLAEAVEYSKGTLYLHFKTKEDIALAVVTRALKERADFFERTLTFQGRSRERIRAIGFACCHFAKVYPDYYNVEMMLKSLSFWEKADEVRQHQYAMQGGRCFRVMHRLVTEGLQQGDLPPGKMPSEQIVFGIASAAVGSHIMGRNPHALMMAGIDDPLQALCQNVSVFLDGLGWKPLSSEWDYDAVDRRIKKELFPEATWLKN